jgi:opacity protein-like surface antigen
MRTLIAIAAMLLTGAAHAADLPGATYDGKYQRGVIAAPAEAPHSWTGVYGGAAIGYDFAKHDLGLSAVEKGESGDVVTPIAGLKGIGGEGAIGSLRLGADYQLGKVVARTRLDYSWSEVESVLTIGDAKASFEKGDEWSAWAGLGLSVTPTTMVYALGGYVEGDFSAVAGSERVRLDNTGYAGAVGVEHALTGNVSIVLEGQYIRWDEQNFNFDGGRLDLDSSELRALFGLNFRIPVDGY